jgi:hypothetical protein
LDIAREAKEIGGGKMELQRVSLPENRKEVYRFWLGFLEKATVVLFTIVVVPLVIGQLEYSTLLLLLTTVVILVFMTSMLYLSQKIWYLPKKATKLEK